MKFSEIDPEEIEMEGFVWCKPFYAVRLKDKRVFIFRVGKD